VTQVELTAQRLLEAEKALGPEHAHKVFQALVQEYKLNEWEIRAVRERFFELLTESKRSRS
jgi:hypothetical protein